MCAGVVRQSTALASPRNRRIPFGARSRPWRPDRDSSAFIAYSLGRMEYRAKGGQDEGKPKAPRFDGRTAACGRRLVARPAGRGCAPAQGASGLPGKARPSRACRRASPSRCVAGRERASACPAAARRASTGVPRVGAPAHPLASGALRPLHPGSRSPIRREPRNRAAVARSGPQKGARSRPRCDADAPRQGGGRRARAALALGAPGLGHEAHRPTARAPRPEGLALGRPANAPPRSHPSEEAQSGRRHSPQCSRHPRQESSPRLADRRDDRTLPPGLRRIPGSCGGGCLLALRHRDRRCRNRADRRVDVAPPRSRGSRGGAGAATSHHRPWGAVQSEAFPTRHRASGHPPSIRQDRLLPQHRPDRTHVALAEDRDRHLGALDRRMRGTPASRRPVGDLVQPPSSSPGTRRLHPGSGPRRHCQAAQAAIAQANRTPVPSRAHVPRRGRALPVYALGRVA